MYKKDDKLSKEIKSIKLIGGHREKSYIVFVIFDI